MLQPGYELLVADTNQMLLRYLIYFYGSSNFTAGQDSTDIKHLWHAPQYELPADMSHQRLRSVILDKPCSVETPCHFAIITDLDIKARVSSDAKEFRSFILGGKLTALNRWQFSVEFNMPPTEIRGKLNEAGRGLELSELLYYRKTLLTFDDRTGAVYEYLPEGTLVPRMILSEGDGNHAKGMKIEWATEKGGQLWVGSMGKEFTGEKFDMLRNYADVDVEGTIIKSEANFWIAVIDPAGFVQYRNWKPIYERLRSSAGYTFPGYLLHEAIMWSTHLEKWIILPRRASSDAYNELADERRGTNLLLIASEDFSSIQVLKTGEVVPERGFSSLKFVPESGDKLIMAVKSVENSDTDSQKSYITIIETLTGKVIMPDVEIPYAAKFEGLEFIPFDADYPFKMN